jgi:hypothetical protein
MIHPVSVHSLCQKIDVFRSCVLASTLANLLILRSLKSLLPSPTNDASIIIPIIIGDAASISQKYYPLQIPPQCSSFKKNEPDTNITMIIIIIFQ